jgi:hypothetical protein
MRPRGRVHYLQAEVRSNWSPAVERAVRIQHCKAQLQRQTGRRSCTGRRPSCGHHSFREPAGAGACRLEVSDSYENEKEHKNVEQRCAACESTWTVYAQLLGAAGATSVRSTRMKGSG